MSLLRALALLFGWIMLGAIEAAPDIRVTTVDPAIGGCSAS